MIWMYSPALEFQFGQGFRQRRGRLQRRMGAPHDREDVCRRQIAADLHGTADGMDQDNAVARGLEIDLLSGVGVALEQVGRPSDAPRQAAGAEDCTGIARAFVGPGKQAAYALGRAFGR